MKFLAQNLLHQTFWNFTNFSLHKLRGLSKDHQRKSANKKKIYHWSLCDMISNFKSMWNTAVSIKNCNDFFHYGLHLRPKKRNTYSEDDVCTMCCYFLGRKCKQFWKKLFTVFDTDRVPGRRRGSCTMECKRDSFSGVLDGVKESHWECVSHRIKDVRSLRVNIYRALIFGYD